MIIFCFVNHNRNGAVKMGKIAKAVIPANEIETKEKHFMVPCFDYAFGVQDTLARFY